MFNKGKKIGTKIDSCLIGFLYSKFIIWKRRLGQMLAPLTVWRYAWYEHLSLFSWKDFKSLKNDFLCSAVEILFWIHHQSSLKWEKSFLRGQPEKNKTCFKKGSFFLSVFHLKGLSRYFVLPWISSNGQDIILVKMDSRIRRYVFKNKSEHLIKNN